MARTDRNHRVRQSLGAASSSIERGDREERRLRAIAVSDFFDVVHEVSSQGPTEHTIEVLKEVSGVRFRRTGISVRHLGKVGVGDTFTLDEYNTGHKPHAGTEHENKRWTVAEELDGWIITDKQVGSNLLVAAGPEGNGRIWRRQLEPVSGEGEIHGVHQNPVFDRTYAHTLPALLGTNTLLLIVEELKELR